MKRIFILFILFSCFRSLSTLAQADENTPTQVPLFLSARYYEGETYKELISLDCPDIPNESFRRVNWLYLEFLHKKKKKSKSPFTFVSSDERAGKHMNRTYFQKPTMKSTDIFGKSAKRYTTLADKATDPAAKSGYRQLAIASHSASIAQLERTQAMERNMAGLELASSIGNLAMAIMGVMVDKWTRQDLNKIVDWGLGDNDSMYTENDDAPELYLLILVEEQPRKKLAPLKIYTIEPKVKYKGELINMAPRTLVTLETKKKYRKQIKKGKRPNPGKAGFLAPTQVMVPWGYYKGYHMSELNFSLINNYDILFMLLRQVSHDYLELMEALEETPLGR